MSLSPGSPSCQTQRRSRLSTSFTLCSNSPGGRQTKKPLIRLLKQLVSLLEQLLSTSLGNTGPTKFLSYPRMNIPRAFLSLLHSIPSVTRGEEENIALEAAVIGGTRILTNGTCPVGPSVVEQSRSVRRRMGPAFTTAHLVRKGAYPSSWWYTSRKVSTRPPTFAAT